MKDTATRGCIKGIYINREYSWLQFNKRVLDQAMDLTNPLLERCKFLSIFTSNLDEFIQVRLGSSPMMQRTPLLRWTTRPSLLQRNRLQP